MNCVHFLLSILNLVFACYKLASNHTIAEEKEDEAPKLKMAATSSLLEQHRKALVSDFKTSFSLLESKFDEVRSAVKDHGQ